MNRSRPPEQLYTLCCAFTKCKYYLFKSPEIFWISCSVVVLTVAIYLHYTTFESRLSKPYYICIITVPLAFFPWTEWSRFILQTLRRRNNNVKMQILFQFSEVFKWLLPVDLISAQGSIADSQLVIILAVAGACKCPTTCYICWTYDEIIESSWIYIWTHNQRVHCIEFIHRLFKYITWWKRHTKFSCTLHTLISRYWYAFPTCIKAQFVDWVCTNSLWSPRHRPLFNANY